MQGLLGPRVLVLLADRAGVAAGLIQAGIARRRPVVGGWQRDCPVEQDRAAIRVPETIVGVDEDADRQLGHGLGPAGPCHERQPGWPVTRKTRVAVERGGDVRDHPIHGGPEGHLFRQALAAFYRDDPHEYRCGVLAPSRELQERIEATLRSPLANRLHSSRYSRLAYPFATRYQNSNQWVVEIIGAAQSGRVSRDGVQGYLRQRGLPPTVLRAPGYIAQSAFALFSRNTRFDDHPLPSRLTGRIAFIMEPSIRRYIEATDGLTLNETVRLGLRAADAPPSRSIPVMAHER